MHSCCRTHVSGRTSLGGIHIYIIYHHDRRASETQSSPGGSSPAEGKRLDAIRDPPQISPSWGHPVRHAWFRHPRDFVKAGAPMEKWRTEGWPSVAEWRKAVERHRRACSKARAEQRELPPPPEPPALGLPPTQPRRSLRSGWHSLSCHQIRSQAARVMPVIAVGRSSSAAPQPAGRSTSHGRSWLRTSALLCSASDLMLLLGTQ